MASHPHARQNQLASWMMVSTPSDSPAQGYISPCSHEGGEGGPRVPRWYAVYTGSLADSCSLLEVLCGPGCLLGCLCPYSSLGLWVQERKVGQVGWVFAAPGGGPPACENLPWGHLAWPGRGVGSGEQRLGWGRRSCPQVFWSQVAVRACAGTADVGTSPLPAWGTGPALVRGTA